MAEEVEEARRRRPLGRLIAAGLLLVALIILAAIWSQRETIATDFIDDELARRGVPASYEVTRIGLRTQRLENLVIGDPRDPGLTAELVEIEVSLGFRAPRIEKITARGVRLEGRLVNGKVSFGSIDKLLPPPTGKPFALPDQLVDVGDVEIGLDTPWGRVGLALAGEGNLANGFAGRLAASAPRLALPGCTVAGARANVAVAVRERRIGVEGPVRAARVLCPEAELALLQPQAVVDASLSEAFDSWRGEAALQARRAEFGDNAAAGLSGRVTFAGDGAQTRGAMDLAIARGSITGLDTGRLTLDGRYAGSFERGRLSLIGDIAAQGVSVDDIGAVTEALAAARGTPAEPLADALAVALRRAARAFELEAAFRLVTGFGSDALRIERLSATSRSGARLLAAGGDGFTYYSGLDRWRLNGDLALSGGGLPTTRISLTQPAGGGPIRGVARIAPFAAGGARLALAPVRFAAGGGGDTRIETVAMLTGPFNDGRIVGLVLPINGRIGGDGGFAFGESCTPASFRALEAAGLRIGPTRLPLCPTGRALLWRAPGGSVRGGAEIRAPRLTGRLGSSPISFAAERVRFSLADPGFTAADVAIRLGNPGFVNRLDLASLSGRFTSDGVVGAFAGGAGQIGNVPLLLSNADGRWSVLGGDLIVDGSLTVADQAELPRFHPLVTNDFHLTLDDGRIDASGWLIDPETGTRVTQATITHDLSAGTGNAVLDVPGIAFTEDYQPEQLTRLTTGVVALVRGTVSGSGEIRWTPQGTTSSGSFSTVDMDLAAPFGPVNGLTTTINFTDLLGLVSAPGQIAEVDLVQTGIDVVDGTIRYQLLPDLRIKVESGRWPFAGGTLILEETVLDFSQPSAKRLTFRVIGLQAANFVQEMEFSNISATGTFDGVIPMIFDQAGGRIVGGRLEARPPGGTLSYIGELTDEDLGTYGKLAFDALKSLSYQRFVIGLEGSLDGEFLTEIELDGIARETRVEGGIVGAIVGQLAKIPFEFNISIRGPFRALMATARSFDDPTLFIQQVLPENVRDLIETQPVQTEESETVR